LICDRRATYRMIARLSSVTPVKTGRSRRAGGLAVWCMCAGPTGFIQLGWFHIRYSHRSALVAGSGANSVRTGCSWRRTTLPRSADPCRRLACSTNTPFYQCRPPRWYRTSNCQQLAAEPLRLRLHTSGIHCQLTSLRQARCPPSVDC